MSLKSQLNSLQYYFKMVSPTLPEISMNKQAIFKGPKQFLLKLEVLEWSFNNLGGYIHRSYRRTMD
jgi:hypothetical protein